MNRSRRRATVITWAIAASMLHGGAGLLAAGLAAADPTPSGESTGDKGVNGRGVHKAPRATGTGIGARRPQARRAIPGPAEQVRLGSRGGRDPVALTDPVTDAAPGEVTEKWPCPWWPVIWPELLWPEHPAHDPRGFTPPEDGGLMPVLPLMNSATGFGPQLGFVPAVAGDYFVDLSPATVQRPEASAAAPLGPSLTGPAPPTPPRVGPLRAEPLSGPSRPAEGGPPPGRPTPVGRPPESVLPGYPEALRPADVGVLAAAALPGLAAIAGLTALGGFLGYRQARAGYLVRAAGVGRFLQ